MKKGPDEMRTRLYRSVNAADLPNIILLFITSCSTLALKTQDFTELKLPVKTMCRVLINVNILQLNSNIMWLNFSFSVCVIGVICLFSSGTVTHWSTHSVCQFKIHFTSVMEDVVCGAVELTGVSSILSTPCIDEGNLNILTFMNGGFTVVSGCISFS